MMSLISAETMPEVPECLDKLTVFRFDGSAKNHLIVDALKEDKAILLKGVPVDEIDNVILSVAADLDIKTGLELQSGFAEMYGHRKRLSKYFMTVNRRAEYQCTLPHSEGSSFQNIQMVSFYCYENSTDGGETILLNTESSMPQIWENVRERVIKGKVDSDRQLSPAKIAEARMRYQINLPEDLLKVTDKVLKESASEIAHLSLVDVLAKSRKTYSTILGGKFYAYWSSISRFDSDSARDFKEMLKASGLYKTPKVAQPEAYDDGLLDKQLWSSGVRYSQLFKGRLFLKLQPGDFLVVNNLSWTHGVNNWTPGSGHRKIGAALA